jgi:hypothetical protein
MVTLVMIALKKKPIPDTGTCPWRIAKSRCDWDLEKTIAVW